MLANLVQPAATTASPTPERFGELFEEHADAVYNFCFRRLANWAVAEDMTSAVFLEAWRRRDRVDLVGEPPLPWLLGVANNLMRNHRRSLRRASAALARFHGSASVPDFGDELADRLDAERRMRAVVERIAALAPQEREALELCAWAELSYEDAARALGVPVGTVRSRLSRARAHLRELLDEDDAAAIAGEETR
jgi:RNA polymerase sigma-70 factor, ECF subfamily